MSLPGGGGVEHMYLPSKSNNLVASWNRNRKHSLNNQPTTIRRDPVASQAEQFPPHGRRRDLRPGRVIRLLLGRGARRRHGLRGAARSTGQEFGHAFRADAGGDLGVTRVSLLDGFRRQMQECALHTLCKPSGHGRVKLLSGRSIRKKE